METPKLTGLNEYAKYIHENNKAKGFWDKERYVGELLMLVVTELSEALEAHRENRFANIYLFDLNTKEGVPFEQSFKTNIKDTFEDEIADAIIRFLDMCNALDIDIEKHIELKVKYNQTRPRLHGKSY